MLQTSRQTWFSRLAILPIAALCVAVAIAILPAYNFEFVPLLSPDQAILSGAVIIGLAIIGAAVIGVGFQFLLREWYRLSAFQEGILIAEESLKEVSNKKIAADTIARAVIAPENELLSAETEESTMG